MGKGISRGGLIALGFVCLGLAPAGTFAKPAPLGKVKTASASAPVPGVQGAFATATATCPSGTTAVSGGFSTAPIPNELSPFTLRRKGAGAWTVTVAQTTAFAAPATLTAYAYCSPRPKRAPQVSAETTILHPGEGAASPACEGGRKSISGGFQIPTDAGFTGAALPLSSSRTTPRTWSSSVGTVNGPETNLTAYAYCARRLGKLRTRQGPETPVPQSITGPTTALSGRCPKRIAARSGGFSIGAPDPYFLLQEVRRAGRRWRVTVRNLDSDPISVTAVAYCA